LCEKLANGNSKTMAKIYEYNATVNRVVDGDTVWLNLFKEVSVDVDFGFHILDTVKLVKTALIDFRLNGINAPEMKTSTMEAGLASKAELTRLLGLGPLRVVSYKTEKYGRWLADIYVTPPNEPEIHVNQKMVDGGFSKAYLV